MIKFDGSSTIPLDPWPKNKKVPASSKMQLYKVETWLLLLDDEEKFLASQSHLKIISAKLRQTNI